MANQIIYRPVSALTTQPNKQGILLCNGTNGWLANVRHYANNNNSRVRVVFWGDRLCGLRKLSKKVDEAPDLLTPIAVKSSTSNLPILFGEIVDIVPHGTMITSLCAQYSSPAMLGLSSTASSTAMTAQAAGYISNALHGQTTCVGYVIEIDGNSNLNTNWDKFRQAAANTRGNQMGVFI